MFETKYANHNYDVLAPDGSEVRLLPQTKLGSMAHVTLPPMQVSIAVSHKTVEEIWYVLSGQGEIWRKLNAQEEITPLDAGCSLTIPLGTYFQFRNTGEDLLQILLITMPPWPNADEAFTVDGYWDVS